MPVVTTTNGSGSVQYKCEHVLALLLDNVLFGLHIVGNIGMYTADVIQYVLSKQIVKHWVLGECDFKRQFEYGWEQENLLSALFSIGKNFTEPYIWTFDTRSYPFKLNLKMIDVTAIPQMYIWREKNMLQLVKTSDPQNICTRLYPLGAGEGINQLGIKEINNNLPYLQSPQHIIDQYGIIERVWVDRRYTDQQSLKESAQAMLNELQEPYEQYQVDYITLGKNHFDIAEIGKIISIDKKFKSYVTGIHYNYDDVTTSTLEIANRPQDIASTVANMADRQRIEMTYSQGATQIFAQSIQANADTIHGAVLNFFISQDMIYVNKVICKIELSPFRAYL